MTVGHHFKNDNGGKVTFIITLRSLSEATYGQSRRLMGEAGDQNRNIRKVGLQLCRASFLSPAPGGRTSAGARVVVSATHVPPRLPPPRPYQPTTPVPQRGVRQPSPPPPRSCLGNHGSSTLCARLRARKPHASLLHCSWGGARPQPCGQQRLHQVGATGKQGLRLPRGGALERVARAGVKLQARF